MTPLTLSANVAYSLKGSYDKTQSNIEKTKIHLARELKKKILVNLKNLRFMSILFHVRTVTLALSTTFIP